jgi:hypothetical protein
MNATPAAVTLRCDACRHVRHDRCLGRQFCSCLTCHQPAILGEARARAARGDRLMAEMVALNVQRVYLATAIRKAEPRYFGGCWCGCGGQVWGLPHGAPRHYVDKVHQRRAQYQRDKARKKAAAKMDAAKDGDGKKDGQEKTAA